MRLTMRWVILLSFVMVAGRCGAVDRYVNAGNPSPSSPYASWGTAATNIQTAVDVSSASDMIWVTNGTYRTGGKISADGVTNRVCIDKAVTVRSVNGPGVTLIEGATGVGGVFNTGTGAVRCVYMTNGPVLSGFTITNGHTLVSAGLAGMGGGVYAADGTVDNCVIIGNAAAQNGGGIFGGSVFNCVIATNQAWNGGGAAESALQDCEIRDNFGGSAAGGVLYGTASRCIIRNNIADPSGAGRGGGAYWSDLFNCLVYGNLANSGGGLQGGIAISCTVCSNSAAGAGGGICDGITATNSIVYFNTAPVSNNWAGSGAMVSCCTTPMPVTGVNNTTVAPTFVDAATGDYRLENGSSCVNAGTNQAWMVSGTDLAGRRRIQQGIVDIGAYELSPKGLGFLWPTLLSNP